MAELIFEVTQDFFDQPIPERVRLYLVRDEAPAPACCIR